MAARFFFDSRISAARRWASLRLNCGSMTNMSLSPQIIVELTSYPLTPLPVCTFNWSLDWALAAVARAIVARRRRVVICEQLYLLEMGLSSKPELSGPIRIVDYDPAWPSQFERE